MGRFDWEISAPAKPRFRADLYKGYDHDPVVTVTANTKLLLLLKMLVAHTKAWLNVLR